MREEMNATQMGAIRRRCVGTGHCDWPRRTASHAIWRCHGCEELGRRGCADISGHTSFKLPPDPSGVLKALPQSVLAAYNNYLPMRAIKSPCFNFKSKKTKGF